MTEEEYFRKHHPDYCYGDRLLSPYWDLFQDGVEFGERQSEKKIEELEKENEILKGDLELWESGGCRATNLFECGVVKEMKERLELLNLNANIAVRDLNDLLTKAKEIIKDLLEYSKEHWLYSDIKKQAEQFLKEIEK